MVDALLTQCQLLLWLDSLLSQLRDFPRKHNLWLGSAVDTIRLDTNQNSSIHF